MSISLSRTVTTFHVASYTIAMDCSVLQLGRKSLLLLGGLGMLTTMVISATLILVFRIEDGDSSAAEYIVVTLICLFMFAFTYGWG